MWINPPNRLVVDVDIREKNPINFPRTIKLESFDVKRRVWQRVLVPVLVQRATLPWGDYTFHGYDWAVSLEKKHGMGEPHTNFFSKDKTRARKAFARMQAGARHRILYWEVARQDLMRATEYIDHPENVQITMYRTCLSHGFQLLLMQPETSATGTLNGTVCLLAMWAGVQLAMESRHRLPPLSDGGPSPEPPTVLHDPYPPEHIEVVRSVEMASVQQIVRECDVYPGIKLGVRPVRVKIEALNDDGSVAEVLFTKTQDMSRRAVKRFKNSGLRFLDKPTADEPPVHDDEEVAASA